MTAEELLKRPIATKKFRIEELDQDFIVRAFSGDEEIQLLESMDPETEKPDARLVLRLALGCCLTPEGTRYFSPEGAKEAIKRLPGHCLQEIGEQVGSMRTDADEAKKNPRKHPPPGLPRSRTANRHSPRRGAVVAVFGRDRSVGPQRYPQRRTQRKGRS